MSETEQNRFQVGVVIPCGENRLENLVETIKHLRNQTEHVPLAVVVCDGFDSNKAIEALKSSDVWELSDSSLGRLVIIESPKHIASSGTLQPKNYGAAWIDNNVKWITHYWFIDSDVIMTPETTSAYRQAAELDGDERRILIGRYEWLPKGKREIDVTINNDYRKDMFDKYDIDHTSVGEIHFALANFGGNIIYPADAFKRVGGFWDDLSAGRVEDGEMGLRCASMGIPMTVVPGARGFHLDHPVNMKWKQETNKKEVPMINKKHPWVQNEGLIVVDKDGKRFDWVNPKTGKSVNTLEIWNYKKEEVSE
jgi:GT2 family glycosyltransferase